MGMTKGKHIHNPRKLKPLADRFWQKVDVKTPDECWVWTANKYPNGYGQIAASAHKKLLSHRVSWELHFGPIPEGLNVCHKCDNRVCCNPTHLFLGTTAENIADKIAKRRGRTGSVFGSENNKSKLTRPQVIEMHRLRGEGLSQRALARQFGLAKSSVVAILRGNHWKEVFNAIHQDKHAFENCSAPGET
jgi:hypothetical protein